ncbi:hypothetical protein PT974_00727 [Cladobotryum mycophilum]|uniref:Cyanovirin-N domain-containing protein n=1 Tax=Cladobotryum mycophilum TaxID=491253 RepID=A0ABR0T1N3_9HYPO
MRVATLFLTAVGMVAAAPAAISTQPVALYVPGTAPGSAPVDHSLSPLGLPGFNHLNRNQTAIQLDENAPFDGNCLQVTLGGHGKVGQATIEGQCEDDSGQWWQTSLNLNQCLGNKAGRLVLKASGNFDSTCRPCTLNKAEKNTDVILKCNCLDQANIPRYTFLELGPLVNDPNTVKLVDGRFVCGNRQGFKSPTL